ncbi:MAG: Gfo/Idh/MocA family oxidoreductase [Treponema sp.]|nr:Gfo/Idh/MocA family oxidoreductase [Treponema sp.]
MNKVRLAVVGLNFGRTHAANIRDGKSKGCELAAVVDKRADLKPHADSPHVPFFTDIGEMLAAVKPEGVVIAIPAQFHKAAAIECMQAGCDVLLEKPVTLTLEEADELIAAEKALGKRIFVGHHHRFDPTVNMAREKIASGDFGRLIGFHIFGTLPKPASYFAQDYKLKRDSGGGPVTSNGIHDADRIRFLCGDVSEVFSFKAASIRGYEVEDTAAVTLRCKNGAVGTYYISDCSHPLSEFTDTYFLERGTIRFHSSSFYRQPGLHIYEEGSLDESRGAFGAAEREKNIRTVRIPLQYPHAREIEFFCRMIREGIEPAISAAEGKKSMELMKAIIESMDTGRVVSLGTGQR